jgi:putative redox protein
MDAKVVWNQNMSFSGSSDSGFSLNLDTKVEQGGGGDGFSPLELLLVGLAGCTAMDVISILQKKRQDVTGFEVRAHAERAVDHPRVFTSVVIDYLVSGTDIDRAAVERAVELSETKYCPAQAMLGNSVPIEHRITIL